MATPINPSTMSGSGSGLTLNGKAFGVGVQASQLKSVGSGLPAGVTVSGHDITIQQAGVTLEGYDLRGYCVAVQANNVTIKNNLFNATGWHAVYQNAGTSGLVVEYNTFDGEKANNSNANLIESDSAGITIRNNEFFNLPTDAVAVVGGLVEHNYFAGSGYQSGCHADAVTVHRTVAPVTIRENYIDFINRTDAPEGTNAAIKIVSHMGAIDNVTVDSNILLGGGYTVYTGSGGNPVSNVKFINNDIGLARYEDLYGGDHGANFVWQNNHSFTTDAHLLSGGTSSGSAAPAPAPSTPVNAPPPSAPATSVPPASSSQKPAPVPTSPTLPSGSGSSGPSGAAITGTEKQDFIDGKAGNEVIYGHGGVDVIAAGAGNDIIVGGKDKDWISGQAGDDVFKFTSLGDSTVGKERDVINDFGFGHDRIDLRGIDADARTGGDQAFHWIGDAAFKGSPGDLRAYFDGHTMVVQADVNGDKIADMEISLGGHHVLTASEFIL